MPKKSQINEHSEFHYKHMSLRQLTCDTGNLFYVIEFLEI